jgi:hypothetical protein
MQTPVRVVTDRSLRQPECCSCRARAESPPFFVASKLRRKGSKDKPGARKTKHPIAEAQKSPRPRSHQTSICAALNAERTRLLAVRADLNTPLLPSNTDAQREAELTRVNGKLYTVAKVQSDKSCPLVAGAWPSSVVR